LTSPARLLDLPKITDRRGNLSFLEEGAQCPFDIHRVAWIDGVPDGAQLGGHALRQSEELIVALAGSVDVVLHDGTAEQQFSLHRADAALHVPHRFSRELRASSTGALVLSVASTTHDDAECVDDVGRAPSASASTTDARHTVVGDCVVVELSRDVGRSGSTTVLESGRSCPFEIRRVYYLFDVPAGAARGGHAHREVHELLVAGSGSFDVRIDDGRERRTITLDRPDQGLYLVPGIWRELHNFSSGSICLVMASQIFEEADYLRRRSQFRFFKAGSEA
jgi:hypothetical protein